MDSVDPYLDENTGELRNLLDAKSTEALQKLEPQIVFANELELEAVGISRTNDFAEVLAIHGQLFKGVYDWAGHIRTVDIKKNSENAAFFLITSKITLAATYVFDELKKEEYLKNLPRESFVKQLAYFYDQLNYIHPFREGNGRVQRVFWSRVARDAGYEIYWDRIDADENNEASRRAAEDLDLSALQMMFDKIVESVEHDKE